ncbi:DUF3806 domain-containing protein [Teredinibacter waterburyi]|jgi:hypothetical protein|uniref:DUF3806 domain-containing protein n=1 Tax=Teredinibacter waterburyi TaxID=1500538 RepID=UPI00165EE45B|nr:DUF3806 domain-containing protein [Teredinibacter waterburyi]
MKFRVLTLLAITSFTLLSTITTLAIAEDDILGKTLAQHESGPTVRELNWLNKNYLMKQRNSVDALTRAHFGSQIYGNRSDLALLQRIVDENLIEASDTSQLQALGVVLGDVLAKENKELVWMVYEDELGPTQSICVAKTKHCLFPVTMLSRRMEVGIKPNVNKVFNDALAEMKPFLPKLPYSVN